MKDKIQIVILAAGKGKRMKSREPKALAKLKGKFFLKHILETLSLINFPIKPVIVVGHKKERIFEVLGKNHNYAHQKKLLGTGHALLSAKEKMHKEHKIVFVISTDQPLISKDTILKIIKEHLKTKSTITIGTIKLPDFKDWRSSFFYFGRIIRNKKGEIIKNVEFKDAKEKEKNVKEINPAIYAFDSEWLWENIDKLNKENSQKEYYLTDLIKIAREQNKKIQAVPITNILEGLQPNTKEDLEILEKLVV
ncbi:MAG: NTP transferase domain-containing protein [Patescibacteria group bacterium]